LLTGKHKHGNIETFVGTKRKRFTRSTEHPNPLLRLYKSLAVTMPKVHIPRILCYGSAYITMRKFIAAKRKTIRGPSTARKILAFSSNEDEFSF